MDKYKASSDHKKRTFTGLCGCELPWVAKVSKITGDIDDTNNATSMFRSESVTDVYMYKWLK